MCSSDLVFGFDTRISNPVAGRHANAQALHGVDGDQGEGAQAFFREDVEGRLQGERRRGALAAVLAGDVQPRLIDPRQIDLGQRPADRIDARAAMRQLDLEGGLGGVQQSGRASCRESV